MIVDEHSPTKGTVLKSNEKVYSCTLNQTDISTNKNKFYIMQIIKNGSTYAHFIRYGRTGETGTKSTSNYSDENSAINAFEKQFKTKTGNSFTADKFVKKANKYFMSQVSYDKELEQVQIPKPVQITNSKLDEKVQQLLSLLTNTDIMQQALISLNIDTKKMPLGKITHEQMDSASQILDKIQNIISNPTLDQTNLISLSSEYYTYLPMAFGRKKPPVISSQEMITNYKDIITELTNMVITVNLTEMQQQDTHPLDSIYNSINTNITPLSKENPIYAEIEKYVHNTQGSTHHCNLQLLDIFEIEQHNKKNIFDAHNKNIDNHHLLFHGSGITNWISIMKNDLLLNPQLINKDIPIAGKMFGYGIYFANCISKSFGYCRTETSNNIGCLALAQVPLGKIGKRTNADCNMTLDKLTKEKCNSIQGMGKYTPSSSTTIDNLIIPNGKMVDKKTNCSLQYDEFIIYKSEQQFIRYLILVKDIS